MRPVVTSTVVALLMAACAGGEFRTVGGSAQDGGGTGGGVAAGGSEGPDSSAFTGGRGSTGASGNASGGSPGGTGGQGVGGDVVGGDASPGGPPADAGPATCDPLPSGATDVYVDGRYTGATSTGTRGCPFTTILAGMTAAASLTGARVVHVAGATPPVVYAEASVVPVDTGVTLKGDGPAKTSIVASGSCSTRTCAVMVNGGAALDGFTVIPTGGDGVVTALTAPPPIVKNVTVNGSGGNGIVSLGAIDLGPGIVLTKNTGQRLLSMGTGLVHVISAGGPNIFDANGANGIDVEGATLGFDGGSASLNSFNGIRFGAAGTHATTHTVTGLTASKNRGTGISAFNGQNLKIRSSSLLANGVFGLVYVYVDGYSLDIGTATDLGGNTFGVATVASRNTKAGIFLCNSRGPATQGGEGETFAACAPTETALAACDSAPASYTDVAYAPAVAGDPLVAINCTVGP